MEHTNPAGNFTNQKRLIHYMTATQLLLAQARTESIEMV